MKYIRTTNGRITDRLSDFNCFKSHGTTGRYVLSTLVDDNNLELWLKYNRTSVLKQADTIEELIDEYYYVSYLHEEYPYTPRRCIKIDNVWRDYDNFGRLGETEIKSIKAGIWTGKGLIYVAEINDKGELELL